MNLKANIHPSTHNQVLLEIEEPEIGIILKAKISHNLAKTIASLINRDSNDLDLIEECLDLYATRIDHGSEEENPGCCYGHDTLIDAREALERLRKDT